MGKNRIGMKDFMKEQLIMAELRTNPNGVRHVRFGKPLPYYPDIIVHPRNAGIFIEVTQMSATGFSVKSNKGNQKFNWQEVHCDYS